MVMVNDLRIPVLLARHGDGGSGDEGSRVTGVDNILPLVFLWSRSLSRLKQAAPNALNAPSSSQG